MNTYRFRFLRTAAARRWLLAATWLLAGTGQAATWTNTTGGTWDNVTGSYWNPATPPASNEVVNLTQPTSVNMMIDYAATSPNTFGTITISNSTAATTTLQVGTGDVLAFGSSFKNLEFYGGGALLQSGGLITGTNTSSDLFFRQGGTYTMTGGASEWRIITMSPTSGSGLWDLRDGTVFASGVGGPSLNVGTSSGAAELRISGGTLTPSGNDSYLGSNGVINLTGGTMNHRYLFMEGHAVTHQTAGTNNVGYEVVVAGSSGAYAGNSSAATYTLDGGLLSARSLYVGAGKNFNVGGAGQFIQNGGAVQVGSSFLVSVSHPNATLASSYTYKGGVIRKDTGSGTDLTVYQLGTFQGYGNGINGTGRTLNNSGRIIANGYGSAPTLDLSKFTTVTNSYDNATTGNKGWFATAKGKLLLPAMSVTTGVSTQRWGEAVVSADAQIDLVNSAELRLNIASGSGTVTGALLAVDRSEIAAPPAGYGFVSVHEFTKSGTFTLTGFDLTIRYDDLAVRDDLEPLLRLYQWNGTAWANLNASVDPVNKLITAQGLTSFGQFGVAMVPETSTLFLSGVGGWLLWRMRRRVRSRGIRN